MMFAYMLFSEWDNMTIYGESLEDALNRAKSLRRPPTIPLNGPALDGEVVDIARVVCRRTTTGSTRGSEPYQSVLIESCDGRINEVDARQKPV